MSKFEKHYEKGGGYRMKVCFLRNNGSRIWANDKEQLIQDIEDNYSYEVAGELREEQRYYQELEKDLIVIHNSDLDGAYEDIHCLQGYLQEINEIIDIFLKGKYNKQKALTLLENIRKIANKYWRSVLDMDMTKIEEIFRSTTDEEKEMLYLMLSEMQIDKKKEEVRQAKNQIDNILVNLAEKYKITDEYNNEISSINLTYFENSNSVIISIPYQ